jgi:hypothetical protein
MAEATYVTFETSVGSFTVELYNAHAPKVSPQTSSESRSTTAHDIRHATTFRSWQNEDTTTASYFTESSPHS